MDTSSEQSTNKLQIVAVLNFFGFLIEITAGILIGSISIISDGLHMLFDSISYIIAFSSAYIAENSTRTDEWNFGFHRLETLSAFINGLLLFPMAGYILYESYKRLITPTAIDPLPVFLVGVFGLIINLISVIYLEQEHMSLNEKGAFYHLIGDSLGSLGIIIASIVVYTRGYYLIDPIVAIIITLIILKSSVDVISESLYIFLQKNDANLDVIRSEIKSLENIKSVDKLLVWNLCSQITVVSVKATYSVEDVSEIPRLRNRIRNELQKHDIDYSTIELRQNSLNDTNKLTH